MAQHAPVDAVHSFCGRMPLCWTLNVNRTLRVTLRMFTGYGFCYGAAKICRSACVEVQVVVVVRRYESRRREWILAYQPHICMWLIECSRIFSWLSCAPASR